MSQALSQRAREGKRNTNAKNSKTGVTYFELIDTLDKELSAESKGLFTRRVDIEFCQKLVKELKSCYPDVIKEAKFIVSNKQQIIDNANRTAAKILDDAAKNANTDINTGGMLVAHMTADLEDCLSSMMKTLKKYKQNAIKKG